MNVSDFVKSSPSLAPDESEHLRQISEHVIPLRSLVSQLSLGDFGDEITAGLAIHHLDLLETQICQSLVVKSSNRRGSRAS